MSSADGVNREVAWRVFADEYDDATLAFKEGDDERAPNYVVTPTGAKVNRLFVVGVLTETENVGNDGDMYRARISDPTGAFVAYAGQYQQEAMSFFADADPPMFVAVVGKARTYEPDDGDRIYTSIRPEEVNGVDGATRDRWNVQTARQTLARIDAVASYFRGTAESDGANALLARLHDLDATAEHYDLDAAYLTDLRRQCLDVLADLAGEEVDEDDAALDLAVEPPAGDSESGAAADEAPGGEPSSDEAAPDEPTTGGAATDEGAGGRATAGEGTADGEAADADEGGFDADDFSDVDQEPVDADGTEPERAADEVEGAETETATDEAGPTGAATEEATEAVDDEPGAADAGAAADDGPDGEDAEWEWDEGERERLEDEFGAEFESASDFDPDEATVGEDTASGDESADVGDGSAPAEGAAGEPGGTASGGARDADEAEPAGEEDVESAAGSTGAEPDAGRADDEDAADSAERERATGGAEAEDGTSRGDAEDETGQGETDDGVDEAEEDEVAADETSDTDAAGAAEDPEDVVMAVLEDAEPEGLSHDEVVGAAAERGVAEDAAEEALDDLLMEGLCYESGDVVKPL